MTLLRRVRRPLPLPLLVGLLRDRGETVRTLRLPVTRLRVVLLVVVAFVVVAVATGKTHAVLVTGAVMATIAAAIVTRVEVEAALTSGTSSLLSQVLLPLLRPRSSHVTITLDNRLRLRSKCPCMTVDHSRCRLLRSSHVHSSSSRTVCPMHRITMNTVADRVPCRTSKRMHRNLQEPSSLARRMARMAIGL